MSKQVKVKLFKKVTDTADISSRIQSNAFEITVIDVQRCVEFTPEQYIHFCGHFLEELDCLDGLDYSNNRKFPAAVEITSPGHQTIYIVPEGYSYPRYIGIDHIESKEAENDK